MRLKSLATAAALLLAFRSPIAAQQAPPFDAHLRSVALRVTDLEAKRQLASATPATIDALLALYSDSVVYEHPNAGAIIRGKDVMRRNMAGFIGSIRAYQADASRVTVGHGVAIVETSARMDIDDNGKWVPVSRHGLRVIEFDARGLVRRIIDYPW
jgi:hypothetical protein